MAIRITGMYSGLDTESIISELASAQSVKKNKLVKAQTKLSWKQDAWKALNTKIYSFYTNVLDNMRFEGSYLKKMTKVSNTNAVSVVTSADAPNSVQNLKITQLAKQGNLTGAALKEDINGKRVTASTKLEDLGFTGDANGEGKFRVKVAGKETDITVTKDMKISDVVSKLQSAGISASFDAKNQRFYVNAKNSGASADFMITANNKEGLDALASLGLMSAYNATSNEAKEYALWASYDSDTVKRAEAELRELEKLIANKKASTDSLLKANEEYQKRLDAIFKDNDENSKYDIDYDVNDKDKVNAQADKLYDELYGPEVEVQKKDEDGNLMFDENNQPIMEKVRNGGLKKDLDDASKVLKEAQNKLAELKKDNTATAEDIKLAEEAVKDASQKMANAQSAFNKKNAHYSYVRAVADLQNAVEANKETIKDNRSYYEVDANGDPVLDADNKLQATQKAKDEIKAYFDSKIATALQYEAYAKGLDADKTATKVDGLDAEIYLNDVKYTNNTNTFEINGLTITAQQTTKPDEEITLTTAEDTDGIFNTIKNFFTEYNKLINEMDALYNADSSKGYEPLLSEEKQGLADSEIEEWEKKIKDSLLRRDSTLRDVSDAMKTVLMQGATVNGKKMYLSDFGINTLGYFNAADNEKGAYHINGDKDDPAVANKDDELRAMIASDPATVQKFFAGLSKNLYDTLTDKMKSIKDTSSAFTVYNDKTMEKEYKDYKDKIAKEETKLNELIDSWYKKFSAMETAMAKLQSKNNAVSGMFGG